MLTETQRKVLKSYTSAHTMLLAQGQVYAKHLAFMCLLAVLGSRGIVSGKMYSCHLFPYGGL